MFSPCCKFSFPNISTVPVSLVGLASISNVDKSSVNPAVYSYVVVLNFGFIFSPAIVKLLKPNSSKFVCSVVGEVACSVVGSVVSVESAGISSSAVFLVIFNVYVCFVFPSSATTTTSTLFAPYFNSTFPVPDCIFAFESTKFA